MRKYLAGVALAAVIAPVAFGSSPALAASCTWTKGTLGQPYKVQNVSAGGQTIYIDDRDMDPANTNPNSDGLWLYVESNGTSGLQRGGDQLVIAVVNSKTGHQGVPHQDPIVVPGPAPVGRTLFPSGIGGGDLGDGAGLLTTKENCPGTDPTPDNHLF